MLKHKKKLFFIVVSIFLLAGCDSANVIQSSHTHFLITILFILFTAHFVYRKYVASSKRWLFNYACDGGRTYAAGAFKHSSI